MHSKLLLLSSALTSLVYVGAANAQINIPVATFNSPVGGSSYVTLFTGSKFGPDSSWRVSNGSVDILGLSHAQSPDGNQSVDVDGASAGAFTSNILIPVAGTVKVDFWFAGNPEGSLLSPTPVIKTLEVSLGLASSIFTFNTSSFPHDRFNNVGWIYEEAVFNNQAVGIQSLTFTSLDLPSSSQNGPLVGTVTVSVTSDSPPGAVPEPSIYGAFSGLALLGLAAWRHRIAFVSPRRSTVGPGARWAWISPDRC